MADLLFPTDTTGVTPATWDIILIADVSDSNNPKDCTLAELPISTATQTALDTKQWDITLTTTGTSWAATLIGDTLNIPQYTSGSWDVATDPIWDAKWDLAVGTGANTASRLAVGTNWQVLTADSAEATGTKWATVSWSGDMILASTQTNSGLKTFLDTTFGLRNVANTFTGLFTNAITAARTWTLPDSNTIIPIISQLLTFSWPTAARTITLPDANFTVARTDAANTFTGTQTIGALVATTLNGNTFTTWTYTLTGTAAKTLNFTNTLTLSGTDSTTMTFPSTSASVARTDAAQTFTWTQTFSQQVTINNAITATANAATVPITSRISTVTNNSAATLTITLTTASAVEGMLIQVRVLDFSAVAQTLTWVNTENWEATVPATSNGSTTLPRAALFQYNSATSKWRCIAS